MKKEVNVGSVVLYRDEEDNEIYPTIITHKTGNQKFKYYRVGRNMLGMIMDYLEPQLQIKSLNKNLKASYDSIEDILKEKKSDYREEALSTLFYYVGVTDERDKRLFQIFKDKGYTQEKIYEKYEKENSEIKQLFVKNGFANMYTNEKANEILNNVSNEKELLNFVKSKNNRNNYFNKGAEEIIFKKLNKLVKNEKIKRFIMFRLIIMSENFVNNHIKEVIDILKEFKDLNENNKSLFIDRIPVILNGVKRINEYNKTEIEGKSKISSIVKELEENKDFKKYIKENIEEYFNKLVEKREYNIGYYFNIEDFINDEKILDLIIEKKISVNDVLKYTELSGEIIQFIIKNGLYRESFEDGSNASELNVNAIANHKNTPSEILAKIIALNKTYLSGDSYGKWDVLGALRNPNINKEFLSSIVKENINEEIYAFGAVENPKCPKELKEKIKEVYGEKVEYNSSGYRMVHNFKEEEKIKTKNKGNINV